MAAHRYWRLFISSVASSTSVAIGELILATTAGGASVATGGTASASSTTGVNAASRAFDGTLSSSNYWQSLLLYTGTNVDGTVRGCEWLQYDFGSGNDKDIAEIRIYFPAGGSIATSVSPSSFVLYYSDNGLNWTRQKAWNLQTFTAGETKTYDTTATPDASITNRLVIDKRYRYNSAAQSQADIFNSGKRFATLFSGTSKLIPVRNTPHTGRKRIAGSTTVLGMPRARVVHLLEQKSGKIINTFNTKADGTFEFLEIADGIYTVLGVDPSAEQNSVVYAHVVAID